MTTWEEIRDELAGMLADGRPLEDVIANLEQRKNETAKANLMAVMDEMKKAKPLTEQEYLQTCTTEQLAEVLFSWYKLGRLDAINKHTEVKKDWLIEHLKQPHRGEARMIHYYSKPIPITEEREKVLKNIAIQKTKPLWGDEHDPCEHCSANPKNGGSGLCNCTLACPKIT